MVVLRDKGVRELCADPVLMVLRLLRDRHDDLSRGRAQISIGCTCTRSRK
jgi:hypothetical protein